MASRGGRGGGGMRGGPMGGGMRGGPGKPTLMPDLLNVSNVHANCYLLIYVVLIKKTSTVQYGSEKNET